MSFVITLTVGQGLLIAGGLTAGATVYGASQSSKAGKRADAKKAKGEEKLAILESERQEVINPYANVGDLSSMISDLSSKLSNPYASLGVATGAAEIEIEEADIALANTLDILRATGASAGGATALAQAALQGKKGVSASIEQQETKNQQLKAQGQQQLEKFQLAEARRVQGGKLTEAQRQQDIDVKGQTFVYDEVERRQTEQLNRVQAQITGSEQASMQARRDKTNIITSGMSAMGNMAMSYAGMQNQQAVNNTNNSDRRLKKNIKLIGKSPKGLKIYAFEYIDKMLGDGVWQGVMSDEIPNYAVVKHEDGFDRVNYSKLDVTFKQI
jgi:hypothetical protein